MVRMQSLLKNGYAKSVLQNLIHCFKNIADVPIYRIIDCRNLELDNIQNIELHVQIVGKDDSFFILAKELYKDDSLINGFSRLEVRTITMLGLIQEGKYKLSRLELESIKFIFGKQQAVFSEKGTGRKIEKNIDELPKCPQLINELSPIEAFRLGMSYEDQRNI